MVLFDEIEKAHPEVFNILLQVLDSGHLTDGKGRKVNFKNTIIVLTSNIGGEFIDRLAHIGFGKAGATDATRYEETKSKVMDALKEHFRPEFLNRLDDIIIFDVLAKEALARIVDTQIEDVMKRLTQSASRSPFARSANVARGERVQSAVWRPPAPPHDTRQDTHAARVLDGRPGRYGGRHGDSLH